MCDPGEKVSNTMRREFMEEALSSDTMSGMELIEYKNQLNKFFAEGVEVKINKKCLQSYCHSNVQILVI
jgi:hypothetical protein